MQLQLLHQTTCLTTYYDQCNDWLFLDWEGELTLPLVQEACAALAVCALHRPYTRVLNSNEQVTGVNWNIATWLVTDFLPHMTLAGVEHIAWVYSPLLRGQHLVQSILSWLPGTLIDAFDNVSDAVTWLQHFPPKQQEGFIPTRLPATQAKLAQEVEAFLQRIKAKQPKLQQWS
jgi:hypothetical protein